jgi:hypothetical protein
MKTPRDILFHRHQPADVKLDQIRRDIVSKLVRQVAPRNPSLPVWFAITLWRELFLPARGIWTGLVAVWMVILALNFATHDSVLPRVARHSAPPSAEVRRLLKQQERWFAELVGPAAKPDADRPKPAPLQPRSQRCEEMKAV